MIDSHPTHCIDCCHAFFGMGACCTNPGVESLSEDDRSLYDDPYEACPLYDPKHMPDEMFSELLDSVQEMDAIVKGKKKASRIFEFPDPAKPIVISDN